MSRPRPDPMIAPAHPALPVMAPVAGASDHTQATLKALARALGESVARQAFHGAAHTTAQDIDPNDSGSDR